jgi:hypothetical protein
MGEEAVLETTAHHGDRADGAGRGDLHRLRTSYSLSGDRDI